MTNLEKLQSIEALFDGEKLLHSLREQIQQCAKAITASAQDAFSKANSKTLSTIDFPIRQNADMGQLRELIAEYNA